VIRLVPDGGAAAAGERVAPADRDRLPDPAAPATLALAADETAVPRLAAWIDDRCAALGLSADLAFQVHLALEELVTNVVEHATRGERSGRIVIDIRDSGAELTVIVADTGPPFDPTRVPPPDTTLSLEDREVGGLGLHLVRSMMDRIAYRREKGHNVVVLGKAIGPAAPSAGEPRGLDGGGDGGDASRP
jgi:serine/threonine-protein kinase RsbW